MGFITMLVALSAQILSLPALIMRQFFFRKIYIAKIKPPLELARFFWIRDKLASIYIWWIYSQVLQEFLIYFTKKTLKTKKENYCLHLKLQLILRYLEIYRCSVNLGAQQNICLYIAKKYISRKSKTNCNLGWREQKTKLQFSSSLLFYPGKVFTPH